MISGWSFDLHKCFSLQGPAQFSSPRSAPMEDLKKMKLDEIYQSDNYLSYHLKKKREKPQVSVAFPIKLHMSDSPGKPYHSNWQPIVKEQNLFIVSFFPLRKSRICAILHISSRRINHRGALFWNQVETHTMLTLDAGYCWHQRICNQMQYAMPKMVSGPPLIRALGVALSAEHYVLCVIRGT